MPNDPENPMDRRRFFREGFRGLFKPIAGSMRSLKSIERVVHQIGQLDSVVEPTKPKSSDPAWLRPPGSIDEKAFRETCSRCGNCMKVCPAQCIRIDPTGAKGNGAPFIEPDVMACVVCDGLLCMHDCPSGAIVPTALGLIDMGTAVWKSETCVRTRGEDCTICIDKCPIGEVAIKLVDGKIHVIEEGCVGCGVCQHECPTNPKSIVVVPKTAR